MSKSHSEIIAFHMRLNAAVGMYADARVQKALILNRVHYDETKQDEDYANAVSKVRGAAQTVSDLITAIKDYELA